MVNEIHHSQENINKRNTSLMIIRRIYEQFSSNPKIFPVLTGSWGIEAVSGEILTDHQDIDINVFYPVGLSTDEILKIIYSLNNDYQIDQQGEVKINLRPYRKLALPILEFSLIPYDSVDQDNLSVRINGKSIQMPLTSCGLKTVERNIIQVKAKSLEYQIATWAIRIFGQPLNPKRMVLDRDIEHLGVLMSHGYDEEKLFFWIKNHPQFDGSEEDLSKIVTDLKTKI